MRRALAVASFLLLAGTASAQAAGIAVPEDEARIITFERPVATVYVGDPAVADVNMIDSTHAFILGKAFGATNMIAMDSKGNQISTRHITVLGSSHLVTLNRGSNQFTFACASARCETASAPGDVKQWHDDDMGEVEKREDLGQKEASVDQSHN